MKKMVVAIGAAAMACGAYASSITVDRVVQRWPWNNKLDITYTVDGGQDVSLGVYARIVFTAHIGTTNITIDGVHDIGANASNGTHTVTWTLPPGLRANDCTMEAQLLSSENPSGDDYMVIDLDTGVVSYEGLLASQADSNARYNTDLYKSTNTANKSYMVLRKVPRWGDRGELPNAAKLASMNGYPTGDDTNCGPSNPDNLPLNTSTNWITDRAYYIGVFPVTQYQYTKIYGSNPSKMKTEISKNEVAHRPVDNVSWTDLRTSRAMPDASIPSVGSNSGTFFQRLNCKTGLYFDMPTEVMWEIATRAGTTTTYYCGESGYGAILIYKDNSGNSSVAVGSKSPNGWGLYDTLGNIFELCLDHSVTGDNMANRTNPFIPLVSSKKTGYTGRGGYWSGARKFVRSSYRYLNCARGNWSGFRVAFIAD